MSNGTFQTIFSGRIRTWNAHYGYTRLRLPKVGYKANLKPPLLKTMWQPDGTIAKWYVEMLTTHNGISMEQFSEGVWEEKEDHWDIIPEAYIKGLEDNIIELPESEQDEGEFIGIIDFDNKIVFNYRNSMTCWHTDHPFFGFGTVANDWMISEQFLEDQK